jgi:enoyl-CoA hydratase/carnithine racemase
MSLGTEVNGLVLSIVIDQEQRRNALDTGTVAALRPVFKTARPGRSRSPDREMRSFSAGEDVKEPETLNRAGKLRAAGCV